MSGLINSTKELESIGNLKVRKGVEYQMLAEKIRIKKEQEANDAVGATLSQAYREQVELLSRRNDQINKEKERLEEIVLDLNGDIKILLSAGTNVADVKVIMN